MNSHELAKQLLEKEPVELLIQKDEEGNGYRALNGVDFEVFVVKERETDVYNTTWNAEECGMDDDEYKEKKENGKGFAVIF